ncbi:hypothetical protein DL240_04995 [Lujinxingia litoralis]|uniref:POTRA domain-containing protein n=1 Tax=Lujinxingia litoralis TaxID=2211119 RepID=A0A328C7J3_9DELT|nr:BamA/TamA family outer membrane protein [Lujinxingia litoralis]RAL23520.1 hypothetical protein DL240_04995 [Lujinxingia litoralis]
MTNAVCAKGLAALGLFTALSLVAGVVNAQESQGGGESYRVDAIVVEGLLRTRREVVEQELLFGEGDRIEQAQLDESLQRLRNTGLFRAVDVDVVDTTVAAVGAPVATVESGRLLRVRVDERWTLLPSIRFGRGGDDVELLLGLQDANLFGSYLQLGGSFHRLAGVNSYSIWFRDPRFLSQRQALFVEGSLRNRVESVYDIAGDLKGGYAVSRRYFGSSLEREWRRWLTSGLYLSFSDDTFSYQRTEESRRIRQEERGGLPSEMQTLTLGTSTSLGRINRDSYLREGTLYTLRFNQSFHFGGEPTGSSRLEMSLLKFWKLPWQANLGVRAIMGFSNVEAEHLQFNAGGLNGLRGTVSMRYRGKNYWLFNAEYRIPSLDHRWLVLQHVAFVDAVGVTPYPYQIFGTTAFTTGVGLRLLSPKIYGLIVRIDYALPLGGADGPGLSFGAGQVF